jgi:hypothetical protein
MKLAGRRRPCSSSDRCVQLLERISGTVLGVLQPLVIADPTGRFNVAYGFVGTASWIGASSALSPGRSA